MSFSVPLTSKYVWDTLWHPLLCQRNNGSNTGKRARRKNLRHLRERFLVSNSAEPSWRPIQIFPAGVKIFLSCPLTGVWFFFSLIFYWKYSIFLHETPHHTWNMTWHIFWRQRYQLVWRHPYVLYIQFCLNEDCPFKDRTKVCIYV
jgi:hypothetical protein